MQGGGEKSEALFELYRDQRHSGKGHEVVRATWRGLGVATDAVLTELKAKYEAGTRAVSQLRDPQFAIAPDHGLSDWDGSHSTDPQWQLLTRRLRDRGLDDAIGSISNAADRVLSLLPNPRSTTTIATRGLVLGYVQSGKTTNFTALIAKAADFGYRVFVVLAGVHNSLRQQTQDRLARDIIQDAVVQNWWCPTMTTDFRGVDTNPAYFFGDPSKRALLVVKKNPAPLRKLNDWLHQTPRDLSSQVSLLVIDDEADQAGLNAGRPGRVTTVHSEVRRLLTFGPEEGRPRVAYVGYTATPFANLLVNPLNEADLYPRHFVVDLPRPEGYYGPEKLFGREALDSDDDPVDGLPVVRRVPQSDADALAAPTDADLLDVWRPALPTSLKEAVRYFLLATAARRVIDGRPHHSTMLVHVSVRVAAQCALQHPVRDLLGDMRTEFEADPASFRAAYLEELRRLPAREVDETQASADAVIAELSSVLGDVEVRVDNSAGCSPRLSYPEDEALTVIAIGGNTLSRGLTLEGLVTSYFIRVASAYDTLLQMGRWFGYRPGYGHLQRIWMTDELASWFGDLATVEEEMRRDIARYEENGATPEDIAVRIRTHPQLAITSAAKMRESVEMPLTYGDSRLQTTRFDVRDEALLRANLSAGSQLVKTAIRQGSPPHPAGSRWVLRDVPLEAVRTFLRDYSPHPQDFTVNLEGVLEHIDGELARRPPGSPLTFNLVVMGKARERERTLDLGLEAEVGMMIRQKLNLPELGHAYIKALMSKPDHRIDLPTAEPDGHATYRGQGEPGVIVLYPIDPQSGQTGAPDATRIPLDAAAPVLGVGIALPAGYGDAAKEGVTYRTVDLSPLVREKSDDVGDLEDDDAV